MSTIRSAPMTLLAARDTAANTTKTGTTALLIVDSSSDFRPQTTNRLNVSV
jgi:hypothetical protein